MIAYSSPSTEAEIRLKIRAIRDKGGAEFRELSFMRSDDPVISKALECFRQAHSLLLLAEQIVHEDPIPPIRIKHRDPAQVERRPARKWQGRDRPGNTGKPAV